MAKNILAGVPLSRNDLLILVHLFEQSFDHFMNQNSPLFPDYIQAVRTLVGLGFTAALADRNLLYIYQTYLEEFLNVEEPSFKLNLETNRSIAQSLAKMIHIASLCFYSLKFPRYYSDFIAALRSILKLPGLREQKEAEGILDRLVG